MRIALLLVGSVLLAFLLAPAPAQAQWCQDINGAYWCGDPDACEGICSQPGSDCTTSCQQFNTWTTCGGSATDSDWDGVGNDTDNCACTSNSNQADCDGDGAGNVCDSLNANYVHTQNVLCMIDRDSHFGYYELEKHYDRVYVDTSSCGAPNTYDTYEDPESAWCTNNYSERNCCLNGFPDIPSSWCDQINEDYCQGN